MGKVRRILFLSILALQFLARRETFSAFRGPRTSEGTDSTSNPRWGLRAVYRGGLTRWVWIKDTVSPFRYHDVSQIKQIGHRKKCAVVDNTWNNDRGSDRSSRQFLRRLIQGWSRLTPPSSTIFRRLSLDVHCSYSTYRNHCLSSCLFPFCFPILELHSLFWISKRHFILSFLRFFTIYQ